MSEYNITIEVTPHDLAKMLMRLRPQDALQYLLHLASQLKLLPSRTPVYDKTVEALVEHLRAAALDWSILDVYHESDQKQQQQTAYVEENCRKCFNPIGWCTCDKKETT